VPANPYSPPQAPLTDPPRPPRSPIAAVLLGLAVDIGGSLLVGIVLTIAYGVSLASSGMSASEIDAAISDIPTDSWVSIVGNLVGAGFSILGGFVCARFSRRSDYKLGFIMGAISAVLGFVLAYKTQVPVINLMLACLTFASVVLGTHFGRLRHA
jgi:hypothetical protein